MDQADRDADALARAEELIAVVADHPRPGIAFRDIAPMLADGPALAAVVAELYAPYRGGFEVVAGVEARGFLLAGAVAAACGAGLVPVRKAGRLPRPAAAVDYELEYGTATIEMHSDIAPGTRVLIVDDVLATGGTLRAAGDLVGRVGGEVVGMSVLLELEGLGGRAALGATPLHAVFRS